MLLFILLICVQPWNTDCMNQSGMTGFMVAMRNDRDESKFTTDFKCRMFHHGLTLSTATVAAYWDSPTWDMRCPNGSVRLNKDRNVLDTLTTYWKNKINCVAE